MQYNLLLHGDGQKGAKNPPSVVTQLQANPELNPRPPDCYPMPNCCATAPLTQRRSIAWVNRLRPTRHTISHFVEVPHANLLAWHGKTKPNTTKVTNQNKCTTTQNKHKELKPGLVACYDIQPGNREGLLLFRCFINLSLTHLIRHLSTYSLEPT